MLCPSVNISSESSVVMSRVRLSSTGRTILPRASTGLTIPVAFIYQASQAYLPAFFSAFFSAFLAFLYSLNSFSSSFSFFSLKYDAVEAAALPTLMPVLIRPCLPFASSVTPLTKDVTSVIVPSYSPTSVPLAEYVTLCVCPSARPVPVPSFV